MNESGDVQREDVTRAPCGPSMTAQDWFDKRALMASRFGVEPRSIPAEAVWFLYDGPVTDADRERAKELAEELGLSS